MREKGVTRLLTSEETCLSCQKYIKDDDRCKEGFGTWDMYCEAYSSYGEPNIEWNKFYKLSKKKFDARTNGEKLLSCIKSDKDSIDLETAEMMANFAIKMRTLKNNVGKNKK